MYNEYEEQNKSLNKEAIMKKLSAMLLILCSVLILFSSCGGGEKEAAHGSDLDANDQSQTGGNKEDVDIGQNTDDAEEQGCQHVFENGVCANCGIELSEGLDFTLNEDGESYGVSGIGSCTDTEIVIPDTYEGKPVTAILERAFWASETITGVEIPPSVIYIGYNVFSNCFKLAKVNISNRVKHIEGSAFSNCTALSKIYIPNSVESLGDEVFEGCSSLTRIVIPDSVKVIGISAFARCDSLTEVVLPQGLESIENSLFYECLSLKTVNIPDTVKTLKGAAFLGCSSLSEIVLPQSVVQIGINVFAGCTSLREIVIPKGVQKLAEGAFSGCETVKLIMEEGNANYYVEGNCVIERDTKTLIGAGKDCVIPADVKRIGEYAFAFNQIMTEFFVPDGIAEIGRFAFRECKSLQTVYIPDSVVRISERAFEDCESLTYFYCESDNEPAGWDGGWYYRAEVVWNYKG